MKSQLRIAFLFSAMSLVPKAFAAGADEVKHCHGTEPFWGLKITKSNIQFEGIGLDTTITIKKSEPISAHGHMSEYISLYQGRTLENPNRFMNVIIKRSECSDGMSDETYPYSVLVLSGNNLFNGCCREN